MLSLALDTGTIGADNAPLVFDISSDGQGLGEQVVAAVQRLTNETRFDCSARVLDIDGSGMAALIEAVRPVSAQPMSQSNGLTPRRFTAWSRAHNLNFALDLDLRRIQQQDVERRGWIRVEFLGDGRPPWASRT